MQTSIDQYNANITSKQHKLVALLLPCRHNLHNLVTAASNFLNVISYSISYQNIILVRAMLQVMQ